MSFSGRYGLEGRIFEKNRLFGRGGVRGIAMCWLCFFYRYLLLFGWKLTDAGGGLYKLISNGYLLVELFFFLSGFFSFMNYSGRIQAGSLKLGPYMKKKIHKLYPLMIITALACTVIQVINLILTGEAGFSNTISLSGTLLSCLGLQSGYFNDGGIYSNPTEWYLSILLLCYLIFWFLCKIKDEDLKRLAFLLWAVLGCALMLKPLNWCLLYESNGRGYFAFAAGALFAQIFDSFGPEKKNRRILSGLSVLLIAAIVWIKYSDFLGSANIVMTILVSPAIMILAAEFNMAKKILSLRILKFYGRISYSLFLWSFPFDMLLWGALRAAGREEWLQNVWFWLIHVILMTMLAYVSWRSFENKRGKGNLSDRNG